MGQVAAGLPLVAEPLSLVRTRFRDREYPAVRFAYREPHAILQTPGAEMSAGWNVAPRPDDVGVEGKDAMGPMLVPSNSSLEKELVDLEEKPLVLRIGMRWLASVGARKNDVADPDQLGSPKWIRR